jgi:type 1 fimbria pilin
MKKLMFAAVALCFVASLVSAVPARAASMTFNGVIIDNMCAGSHKAELADFIKTHTKDCALMPGCVASGYAIYADGKLYEFDKASNAKVVTFLKKKESKLQVKVVADKVGGKLSLVSIENAK